MNTHDYVKDFIEGKVKPSEFMATMENGQEIYNWLQSIIPKGKVFHKCHVQINEIGQNAHVIEVVPYDIRLAVHTWVDLCRGQTWCTYYYVHMEMTSLWKEAFPDENIVVSNGIRDRFFWELEVIPRYIGGKEIYKYGILDEIIDHLPEDLSDTEKKYTCHKVLQKVFHLDESHRPYWRQEAEWPLGVGHKPMQFLEQKQIGNLYEYYFEDVETKELKIVKQVS